MPTLVCIPIMVHEADAALADARQAKLAGADLVEYRVDECFAGEGDEEGERMIRRVVSESPMPCIVTCRSGAEGGGYTGGDDARISLYEGLCVGHGADSGSTPRYIDVEAATFARSANLRQKVKLAVNHPEQLRDVRTGLILSSHDFSGRPADLVRRIASMRDEPAAAVVKIAYRARTLRDSLEILDLPAMIGRPAIALGMGEFGLLTRVLAPKFGGFLTFAALRPGAGTAPGQPTIADLLHLYRFRSIRPSTAVYGVVGWPVGHSLSPLVHNAGFEAAGIDAVYLPLPIAAAEDAETSYLSFKATLLELLHHPGLGLRGCSITLPHKENLVRLAREQDWAVSAAAASVGAANTLIVGRNAAGEFSGATVIDTDGPALASCLVEGGLGTLRGRRIAILGAGGVARNAAFALASAGATVVVYNRTPERAQRLANELNAHFEGTDHARAASRGRIVAAEWSLLPKCCCEALINCTPVGMKGGPAEGQIAAPLAEMKACEPSMLVMDTVYNPLETPLLKAAKELGFATIDGARMFVAQAAAQFDAWHGRPPAADLYDRLVRERLGTPAA